MNTRKGKTVFKKYGVFLAAVAGICFGIFLGAVESPLPEKGAFSGGFAYAFPKAYAPDALLRALFLQFLPPAVICFSAYGYLLLPVSAVLTGGRGIFAGYLCAVLYRMYCTETQAVFWFLLFALCEGAVIGFYLSLVRLSGFFFEAYSIKKSRKKVMRYTGDFLFFEGMILLFYLLRGCIVSLLER